MFETVAINNKSKEEQYAILVSQAKSLVDGEKDLTANLGNIMSLLKYSMDFFWVGLYKVDGETLVLSSFQGPVACTRIPKGKGVCGNCWSKNETIIVPNVDEFPGHIACSSETKSEIVLPVRNNKNEVSFVLDIDSEHLNHFDKEDQIGLEKIVQIIEELI